MKLRSGYGTLYEEDEHFAQPVIFTIDDLHQEVARPLRVDLEETKTVDESLRDDMMQECTESCDASNGRYSIEEDRTGVPHDL